jgi:protein SCO1/2
MRRSWLIVILGSVLVAVLAAGAAWRLGAPPTPGSSPSAVGGPFTLTNQSGAPVDQTLLRGKWTVVFFGYTFCPDVCPTTLANLGQAIDRMGTAAKGLQVVFVSVDPGRDTPPQLKTYLSSPAFPKGTVGLTGTPAQIAAVAKAYRVYYRRAGDGPGYTVDHTAIVYLMDPEGRFSRPLDTSVVPAALAAQIKRAMAGQ